MVFTAWVCDRFSYERKVVLATWVMKVTVIGVTILGSHLARSTGCCCLLSP